MFAATVYCEYNQKNQTVVVGDSATLNIAVVVSTPLAFQWSWKE